MKLLLQRFNKLQSRQQLIFQEHFREQNTALEKYSRCLIDNFILSVDSMMKMILMT